MVMVDREVSEDVFRKIDEEIANEPTDDEVEEKLINQEKGCLVGTDIEYKRHGGKIKRGFYMNRWLKNNFDSFLIRAVKKKFDGVGVITGMEGSGKSTATMGFAKYVDPTFPGDLLEGETTLRKCTRIVFSTAEFMKAIDDSKPGQAIVFDECVMGMLASDASTELQKTLIKKMVTIRKKRLYIFLVIPSIFLLRKYMAIFRSRFLIHFYTPDGITRGQFKFYSYDTKRRLYIRGIKEFNQDAVKADFIGDATNLEGFFFNVKEYEDKKDAAIKKITEEPEKKKKDKSKKNIWWLVALNKLYTIYKTKFDFDIKSFHQRALVDEMYMNISYEQVRRDLGAYKEYMAELEREALQRNQAKKLD